MERLRLACYSYDPLEVSLDERRFQFLGVMESLAEILAQKPDILLIGTEEEGCCLELIERISAELPSGIMVLVGSLDAGSILEALRAGIHEVVPPVQLTDALDRAWFHYHARLQTLKSQNQLSVVHSPKGGAGTSTLALNLAACLARQHEQEVGLVDLCLQSGALDLMLDVEPRATWSDLCQICGGQKLAVLEELEQVLTPSIQGMRLLAAPSRSEDCEVIGTSAVEQALGEMRRKFAYTVVDTPSVLNELTLRGMELADWVLVVVPLTLPALRQAKRSIELWKRLGIPSSKIVVLVWGRGIARSAARKILKHPVLKRLPTDQKGIEAAMNLGESLFLQDPRCAYSQAIARLSTQLFANQEQMKPQPDIRRIWSRLWRCNDVSKQQVSPHLSGKPAF